MQLSRLAYHRCAQRPSLLALLIRGYYYVDFSHMHPLMDSVWHWHFVSPVLHWCPPVSEVHVFPTSSVLHVVGPLFVRSTPGGAMDDDEAAGAVTPQSPRRST